MSASGGGEGQSTGANNANNIPAIGYEEHNVTVNPNQPRQPTNLQDLLRFTAEAAGSQHDPNRMFMPMDEERRHWLENTLKSLTVDVVEELLKAIEVLKEAGTLELQDDPTNCENALETISDYVDNMDTANDFHKIGGFCIFRPCLGSAHSSLRWRAAEIIAELTQNNPYCQERILEAQLLPVLSSLVDNDPNEQVKVKALYAISCLVRENKKALKEFNEKNGYSVILRAMQSDIEKLKIKSAFLLSSLCSQNEQIKDELCEMGFVVQLAGMVTDFHQPVLEHLLSALLNLVSNHPKSQSECRRPELNLQDTLANLVRNTSGKDEYMEEHDYAQQLLCLLFQPVMEEER
ncbi:Uncharacterized protein GBIM_18445 [Gryllus bimaculatus]|nr:Uncharacterized protein GBIM_18445 [Gryllus bimaculatus]